MELQVIQNKIYEIRGFRVMFDFDLASLYNVQNRRLREAVKRNIERFPGDFRFELTKQEWVEVVANCDNLPENAKFSPVTPYAFTQEGVAMLSGILRSPIAIQVNINIMRAFVAIRQFALIHSNTLQEIEKLKKQVNAMFYDLENLGEEHENYDKQFDDIYMALADLAAKNKQQNKPRNPIGFDVKKELQP